MRVALIGAGMVAHTHASAIAASENNLHLCGVFSRTTSSAQKLTEEFGGKTYDNFDALISDKPDFVSLTTPPNARLEFVEALADARIPLIVEKPIERDALRAHRIVRIYETKQLPLGVLLQHRVRSAAVHLMRIVDAGSLGDICTIELRIPWWREQSYYDEPGRGRFDRDGGGVLITQAIHQIDLMLQICGPVTEVSSMTTTSALHRLEAEDFAGALVRFTSGAVGTITASVTHYPGSGEMLTVNGTRGAATLEAGHLLLHLHGEDPQHLGETGQRTGSGADPMAFSNEWHRQVLTDFADAVQKRQSPQISARSALAAQALIDAIQASARSRQWTKPEQYDE